MNIKFQLNKTLKFSSTTQQFIISCQDEDLFRYIHSQISQQFSDATHIPIILEQTQDWQILIAKTQNYTLLPESYIYTIDLHKSAMQIKSLPQIQVLPGDIYIFKTNQFKHNLLSALEQQAHTVWIQAYSPMLSELWQWLQAQLPQMKWDLQIKSWLLEQSSIQFRHCAQLVEKLKLCPNQTSIDLEKFMGHLGIHQDEHWQALIDSWMNGDLDSSIQKLRALSSQQDCSLLIWLLSRNLQVLFALKQQQQNPQNIFNTFKIWPKQTGIFLKAQHNFSLKQLANLISKVQEIDLSLKSGRNKIVPRMLEQFLIQSYSKPVVPFDK